MKKYSLLFLILVFGIFAPLCALPVNDAIAYWSLDTGSGTIAYDTTGNNHNGDFSGNTTWASGISGSGLRFDGNWAQVVVPDSPSLRFGVNTSFSVAFWVKRAGECVVDYQGFIGKGGQTNSGPGFEIFTHESWNNANLRQTYSGGSLWGIDLYKSTNIGDGEWHFIATVTDRATNISYVYIDGSDNPASVSIAGMPDNTSSLPLTIGANGAGTLNGYLDEIGIWNRALSANEINLLYNNFIPEISSLYTLLLSILAIKFLLRMKHGLGMMNNKR